MDGLLSHFSYVDITRSDMTGLQRQFLGSVEAYLRRYKARDIKREGSSVEFSGGCLRLVTSVNPLNGVSHGKLSVEKHDLTLRIACHSTFGSNILMGTVVFAMLFLSTLTWAAKGPMVVMLLIWLWVMWMIRSEGKTRLRRIVKRCAEEVGANIVEEQRTQ